MALSGADIYMAPWTHLLAVDFLYQYERCLWVRRYPLSAGGSQRTLPGNHIIVLGTRLYIIWRGLITAQHRPNPYGDDGIFVCARSALMEQP